MKILSKFWDRLLEITKLIIEGVGIKLEGLEIFFKKIIIGGTIVGYSSAYKGFSIF